MDAFRYLLLTEFGMHYLMLKLLCGSLYYYVVAVAISAVYGAACEVVNL